MQCRFTNPATGTFYDFQVNPDQEDPMGKTRKVSRTAPTGNVGLVRQQGDESPMVIGIHGKILHRLQWQAFWATYRLCQTQTVNYRDWDGNVYEVQITAFNPVRVRKLSFSGRDPSLPHHYYTYDMTLEVYRFISGDLADAGVTP